jgi:hypothetical protein
MVRRADGLWHNDLQPDGPAGTSATRCRGNGLAFLSGEIPNQQGKPTRIRQRSVAIRRHTSPIARRRIRAAISLLPVPLSYEFRERAIHDFIRERDY